MSKKISLEPILIVAEVSLETDWQPPAPLTPTQLSENEVVPKDWVVGESMSSSAEQLSIVNYRNNVRFELRNNSLKVLKNFGPDDQEIGDVISLGQKLASQIQNNYHSVSLRFEKFVFDETPTSTITERLLNISDTQLRARLKEVNVALCLSPNDSADNDSQLDIRVQPGQISHPNSEVREAIHIEAIATYRNLNVAQIHERLESWQDTHSLILSTLDSLMKSQDQP